MLFCWTKATSTTGIIVFDGLYGIMSGEQTSGCHDKIAYDQEPMLLPSMVALLRSRQTLISPGKS
jgi:hypothetical protein